MQILHFFFIYIFTCGAKSKASHRELVAFWGDFKIESHYKIALLKVNISVYLFIIY